MKFINTLALLALLFECQYTSAKTLPNEVEVTKATPKKVCYVKPVDTKQYLNDSDEEEEIVVKSDIEDDIEKSDDEQISQGIEDPANPVDPVNPTNPTNSTNPANPEDPVNPTNSTNPANPDDQVKPEKDQKVAQKINLTPVDFELIKDSKVLVTLYIDERESEYDGISLIAQALKSDVARVIGDEVDKEGNATESDNGLKIVTKVEDISKKAIIAGTFGEKGNDVINQLVKEGKINIDNINGRWERYQMQVVKAPIEGVEEALVIVGSDKRGTLYGMMHVSEMMGVSPWVWWSDVLPAVQSDVTLPGEDCNIISKEPSIKYRGIFLNDEAPSLTTWTNKRYGGRNQYFYRQVFELLIRLKANYLWPSMWDDVFSADGEGDTLANAKLADKYGIVMGTSHHEPLYRAGKEWGRNYRNDLPYTSGQAWNLYNIPGQENYHPEVNQEIEEFWDGGVSRNRDFENICTVGMRGEDDSTLPAADDPPRYADLLNYIINTQKGILKAHNDTNPTQLVIYKEVEDAWYAGELYNKDCMKDTYAMFCDDNWAYMRTLPTLEQQKQIAGSGMYYHFDYVGAPKSYTWVQNTQISTIWDQMSIAYDYGIEGVWIANVGDLKPMEINISYFLDLAYDYEYLGIEGEKRLDEYKKNWAKQQFSRKDGRGLTDEQCDEAAYLIDRYLDLETKRVVEHVLYNTADTCSDMYSIDNYNEALNILAECDDIMKRTEALWEEVPDELKADFYQLVYYPAMAVPNVLKIQIYAALNNKYAKLGLTVANKYAKLCQEAIDLDNELFDGYNEKMPGVVESGKKWSGMISCGQNYHIGLQAWDRDSGKLPDLMTVEADENSSEMEVLVEDITNSFNTVYTADEAKLPTFNSVSDETFEIQLLTKGGAYKFEAKADEWIKLSDTTGKVTEEQVLKVSIDWSKVKEDTEGVIVLTSGEQTVKVNVEAKVIDAAKLESKTYVMTHDYATIDVANYSKKVDGKGTDNQGKVVDNKMIVIPDNGKYLSTIRTTSSTITYETVEDLKDAPYVEYKVYVPANGTYNLESQFNPTSNLIYGEEKLRYGISIDDGEIDIINTLVPDYLAGTWKQGTWASDIENNSRRSFKNDITLDEGVHTIRYYQCDPNLALIRMTLFKGKLATVYGSPAESTFIKN